MGGRGGAATQRDSTPFSLRQEVFREDREGFVFSKTSAGDLYLGSSRVGVDPSAIFMKDTPENRERLNNLFNVYSNAKEVKRR